MSGIVNSSGDQETFQPKDRADWRRWLDQNHDRSSGVWLVIFKKGARQANLTLDDAVEEALSFGWIDSRLNPIDEERFRLRFTPRRPGSIWSARNKRRVEALLEQGLMTPAGLAKVEAAKRDGTWDQLNEADALIVPPDLMRRLDEEPEIKQKFVLLSPSMMKRYLFWITQAKRPETRSRRIDALIREISEPRDEDRA